MQKSDYQSLAPHRHTPSHLHLIGFHGVLAPNEKLRCEIIPRPAEHATEHLTDHAHAQSAPARMSWARLLKRVYDIDTDHCLNCAGTLKIIAAIEDPPAILRILPHLGLPTRAPPPPPRGDSIYSKRFDLQAKTGSAIGPTIRLGPHSRGPPEGDAINRLAPMPGLNHSRNSAKITRHSCD